MSGNAKINLIKQNTRMKQFIGWFIACMLPFSTKEIMDVTREPLLSALLCWIIGGVLLRFILEKKLPFFKDKFSKVRKEVLFVLIVTVVVLCVYIFNIRQVSISTRDLILNFIFFAILKGTLEQLIVINIYDLAGCRIKLIGFIAAYIYEVMVFFLFWSRFIPMPDINNSFFILLQGLVFTIPLIIYEKTEDITLWSIQHIIYNLVIVYFSGFGINMFIHI